MDLRRITESSIWVKATLAVAAVLAVVVGGLFGLAVDRADSVKNAASARADDAALSASAGAALVTPPASATPAAGAASRAATATASSTPLPPPTSSVMQASPAVANVDNEMRMGASGLFAGAVFARGVYGRPSTGGVVLSTPYRGVLSGTTIVVDPGHQGVASAINNRQVPDGTGGRKDCQTTGTATNGGYTEHAYTWTVGTKLAAVLRARGARVVLTRPNDAGVGPCVNERAAIGNRAKANLVISIHADGSGAGNYGFHVIRSTKMAGGARVTAASARLATVVRDTFAQVTGRPRSNYLGGGTGITPRTDIAGTNLSTVPAVMVETGNMRNATEARLLQSAAFQNKEAAAFALAAQRYLGR